MFKKMFCSALLSSFAFFALPILFVIATSIIPSDLELEIESTKQELDRSAQENIVSNTKTTAQIKDQQKLVNVEVHKTPFEEEKNEDESALLSPNKDENLIPYVQQ
ncbi:MAG: hypothetical protein HY044_00775 [Candidatus Woesebacteria bacterium]|nr:MAG: hypothetical protein HY044_00775 [Candidatus Woesebacteria bacterium]